MNVENASWTVGWPWDDFRVGAVARYTCDQGYTLFGSDTIECQSNGSWSRHLPRCLVQCKTAGFIFSN